MLEAVVFVVTVVVVGALLFLGGSVLLGRGETQPPADPDRSPLELPEDRPVTAAPPGLAVVFQEYGRSLFPWLRVRDNVELPLRAQRIAKPRGMRKLRP